LKSGLKSLESFDALWLAEFAVRNDALQDRIRFFGDSLSELSSMDVPAHLTAWTEKAGGYQHTIMCPEVDDEMDHIDNITTGGLLFAKINGPFDKLRVRAFLSLTIIDWEGAVEEYANEQPSTGMARLQSFITGFRHRVGSVCCFRQTSNRIETAGEGDPCAMTEQLVRATVRSRNQDPEKRCLEVGRRYERLCGILGSDGILLFGNPRTTLMPKQQPNFSSALYHMDVHHIVVSGTALEFERLIELLIGPHSWIRDICNQLHGLTALINQFITGWKPRNLPALRSLAGLIQERVMSVFGDRRFIERTAADTGIWGERIISSASRRLLAAAHFVLPHPSQPATETANQIEDTDGFEEVNGIPLAQWLDQHYFGRINTPWSME
jgi:hypothetical protein